MVKLAMWVSLSVKTQIPVLWQPSQVTAWPKVIHALCLPAMLVRVCTTLDNIFSCLLYHLLPLFRAVLPTSYALSSNYTLLSAEETSVVASTVTLKNNSPPGRAPLR